MLTDKAGQPVALKQHWHIYDLTGRPMTGDTLWARAVLWHDRRRKRYEKRPDVAAVRGITITPAGRAYLAALGEQAE